MKSENHPEMKRNITFNYMGVSKNNGTPKWMVYNGKPYKWMIWGHHYFWKHPYRERFTSWGPAVPEIFTRGPAAFLPSHGRFEASSFSDAKKVPGVQV